MKLYQLDETTAGAVLLILAAGLSAAWVWFALFDRRTARLPTLKAFLLLLLFLPAMFDYYAAKMAWAEFVSVGLGEDRLELAFVWPRKPSRVELSAVKSIRLLEMWHGRGDEKRSNFSLIFEGAAGELGRSVPTKRVAVLEEAARHVASAAHAPVSRWSMKGRLGTPEQVQEFVGRP
ncbi:MAG: hypothetical protein HYY25_10240 [Candidatus Wallbacteria bacterium]|nr:hypothetical protein [Candidatus Wallbacteria bacterium]